jgi:rhodanese-related sulfurtransferase
MKYLKKFENKNNEIHSALLDYIKNTKSDWNYITPEELNKEDLSKYYIIDLREEKEYKKGHIKGAKNIFWMDILEEENLKKLPKDKTIILVCYVGHTASQIMVALKLLGYDVVTLKFGMGKSPVEGVPVAGWLDFGFDIED